jgi:hypothetical protein
MLERSMRYRKNLLIFIFIALILASVPALVAARPAEAKVDLHAGKGEAVWFYRSCTPAKLGAVATWSVDLDPAVHSRTSLKFQVKNAYPGYQLICELYFANSGKLPIRVKEISVYNPNSKDLILSAVAAPGEQKKILQPCNFKPAWGRNPAGVSSSCRSKITITLTLGPNVKENSRLDFAVRVRLEENPKYY